MRIRIRETYAMLSNAVFPDVESAQRFSADAYDTNSYLVGIYYNPYMLNEIVEDSVSAKLVFSLDFYYRLAYYGIAGCLGIFTLRDFT